MLENYSPIEGENHKPSTGKAEAARETPDQLQYRWRMPDDKHYTEDPWQCFERTVEQSQFVYQGPERLHPETALHVSVPVYHQEWLQGNLQRMLRAFLVNARQQDSVIEINLIVNSGFMTDRLKPQNNAQISTGSKYVNNYPEIAFLQDKGYLLPTTVSPNSPVFSQELNPEKPLTHEDYLEFRRIKYGDHIPYQELMSKWLPPETAQRLDSANQQMVALLTAMTEAQAIARTEPPESPVAGVAPETKTQQPKAQSNFFNRLSKLWRGERDDQSEAAPSNDDHLPAALQSLMDRYQDHPELQELVKLAYEQASKVQLSFIDTIQADYLAEGYGEKGIASVRSIGADYASLRVEELQQRLTFATWDCDMISSSNYVDELVKYYQRNPQRIAVSAPVAVLPNPGTTRDLVLSTIEFTTKWTYAPASLDMASTPFTTMTEEALLELGGFVGGSSSSNQMNEDRRTNSRLQSMIENVPAWAKAHLQHPADFPPIVTFMADHEGFMDGADRSLGSLAGSNKGAGVSKLIEYLQSSNFYPDGADFDGIPNGTTTEKRELYERAYEQYFKEYMRLARLNRATVKKFLKLWQTGRVVQNSETQQIEIVDLEKVPAPVRSELQNYVEANQLLLRSLSEDEWLYMSYLVGLVPQCPVTELSDFHLVLREYLGEPVSVDEAVELCGWDKDQRTTTDKASILYSVLAHKLAVSLVSHNYEPPLITNPTLSNVKPTMAAFSERTKSIQQAMGRAVDSV